MSNAPHDERALLAAIANGEPEAFEALVRPHLTVMLRYAYGILRTREGAEDVVQDVLSWVWDNRAGMHVRGSMRSYLLSAVRNRALNALTHARAEARWEDRYEREDVPPGMSTAVISPHEALEERHLADAILQAIGQLPERRRQILLLRREQLTHTEIAAIMDISVKTVEGQITAAFATLRTLLADWVK